MREMYSIQHDGLEFYTGRSGERQVLLGLIGLELAAAFFNLDGAVIEVERRKLGPRTPKYYEAEHEQSVRRQMDQWATELGLIPGAIQVRCFAIPDLGAGIVDPPWHIVESKRELSVGQKPPDELKILSKEVEDWEVRGLFVLNWGRELWLNSAGVVHST